MKNSVSLLCLLILLAVSSATADDIDSATDPGTVEGWLERSDEAEAEGNSERQEYYIRQALALAEARNDRVGQADAWRYLSFVHGDGDDIQSAIEAQQKSLQLSEQSGYEEGRALALSNLGMYFFEAGMLAQASEHLNQALPLLQELDNTAALAGTLNNLAIVEEMLGHYDTAERLYGQLYEMALAEDDIEDQMYYYVNMIDILMAREEYQRAESYLKRALELNTEDDAVILAYAHTLLADLAAVREDFEQARVHYQQALEIAETGGSPSDRTMASIAAATFHFKQGELEQAETLSQQALEMALSAGINRYTFMVYELLYQIAEAQGDHAQALEHFKAHIEYRDQVFGAETARELQRQRMQAEFDKREALAHEELRRQSLQRNASVGGLLFALAFMLVVLAQRNRIKVERDRSETLLLNILPFETAQELKQKGYADAQTIKQVTVLFTDFSGFTQLSETLPPDELVAAIHECFSAFDRIMEKHGVEKIKTIGDAYMAAGGLPTVNTTNALDVVHAALEIQAYMQEHASEKAAAGLPFFRIRIGVHTGPVVAGIVGIKKFQYDIWGDTVNTAARMESSGEVGRVNISQTTQRLVQEHFDFEFRGQVEAKGKGKIEMYFVNLPKPATDKAA